MRPTASELPGFTCTIQYNTIHYNILLILPNMFFRTNLLHDLTNNEPEYGIENFEFIVSERVHVNPDNSRAMSALTFKHCVATTMM